MIKACTGPGILHSHSGSRLHAVLVANEEPGKNTRFWHLIQCYVIPWLSFSLEVPEVPISPSHTTCEQDGVLLGRLTLLTIHDYFLRPIVLLECSVSITQDRARASFRVCCSGKDCRHGGITYRNLYKAHNAKLFRRQRQQMVS